MYWFPCIETVLAILVVWYMPKRLTRQEIYITWAIMAGLTLYIDSLFVLLLKLYIQGTPKFDWQVYIFELLLPPACGVILLNFMPVRQRTFAMYLLFVVIPVSLCNEWLAVHFRYITYTGWKLWYSPIFYVLGMILLRWQLRFIRANPR